MRILSSLNRIYCEDIYLFERFQTYDMKKIRLLFLFSKIKAGKKEYFEEFYRLTKGAVWYVIRKYVGETFLAEDVMQEAYLTFLNKSHLVKGDPLPYLCSIAKNKAIDCLKKDAKIDKNALPEDLPLSTFDSYESDAPLLQLCKNKLDEEEFFILEHTVIYGYTRVDVAKLTGKPVSTVNRQYNKILDKIRIFSKEVY